MEPQKKHQKEHQKELRVTVEPADGSNDLASATYSLRARRELMSFRSAIEPNWMTNRPFLTFLGKTPNYRVDQDDVESEESEENGSDFQESDDEPSEPGEESGGEVGCDGMLYEENDDQVVGNEMRAKRVKTEHWTADGEVCAFDDPIRISQQPIKREPDSDGQTEDDQPSASKEPKASEFISIQNKATAFDCYDFNDLIRKNQSRMKAESRAKSDNHLGSVSRFEGDQDGERPMESNAMTSANLKLVFDVEYRAPD